MAMMYSLLRKSLRSMGYEIRRMDSATEHEDIAFLHIGKNAGTQIRLLSKQIEALSGKTIRRYGHSTKLLQIDASIPYFFSIRNPISRFKSGFYSRKRKGQPRIYKEWGEGEARAFADFEDANDLAESLFDDGLRGRKAFMAIESIAHNARHQVDNFVRNDYFLEMRPPIWIIRQESFEQDFEQFLMKADVGVRFRDLVIAKDELSSHRNSYDKVPELSPKAKDNLMQWYKRDLEFYRVCEAWMNENLG
jgi:hypothetical protein